MCLKCLALCKEITSQRAKWPKPTQLYEAVSFFGSNIVATEGDIWKKHRKIAAPAFSEVTIRPSLLLARAR